jgi:hypothetical protein
MNQPGGEKSAFAAGYIVALTPYIKVLGRLERIKSAVYLIARRYGIL